MVAGPSPAAEDLTARARIRDAALQLFAERGIGKAPIRDIAAEAGVSPGLVRHHFGSKEALRDACDAYAMDRLDEIRAELFQAGHVNSGFLIEVHPSVLRLQRYLVRSMMDGSDRATAMFDRNLRLGEEWLAEQGIAVSDPRAYVAVMLVMQMGLYTMHEQLSRVLGADVQETEGYVRMTRGLVDFYSHALLSPEVAAELHATLERLQRGSPTGGARHTAHPKEYDDDRGDPR
ncbi:TetR/AcrR family transcriptional regulator [Sphaerisporangium rubeum]|uniref:AcrR family transcriptional regulator n=1 Tax=Sphaerisporangium rubeum TaxID=321317 RepID=A0A7X0M5B2_9ACTN|nr:TetR/AcrR family transcriptional regulator [Sphaerisporangium rubeum]MBB6470764.1 AcrR family transcriptional regulator [Sphaerisporangium rubeum]